MQRIHSLPDQRVSFFAGKSVCSALDSYSKSTTVPQLSPRSWTAGRFRSEIKPRRRAALLAEIAARNPRCPYSSKLDGARRQGGVLESL